MTSLRVAIADDDEHVCGALSDVLSADERFHVVSTCSSGHALLALLAGLEAPLDVVLVDVRMPGGGPDLVRGLLAADHPPRVLAVSADTSPATVQRMLDAGATGYITKGRIGSTLPDLVRQVADGDTVVHVPAPGPMLRPSAGG